MRVVVTFCVMLAFSGISSGFALLDCPFLVSPSHSSCCHEQQAPKQCPLSSSFETCPLITPDGKVEPPGHAAAAVPIVATGTPMFVPVSFALQPVSWQASQAGLHLRIRVLLI
jgi:hypothetical protein